jgi:ribosomal protein S14
MPAEVGQATKSLKGRMSCGGNDCNSGLHCFRLTKKKRIEEKPQGVCQVCGEDQLVDWPRVNSRDLSDVNHTIATLKKEWVRHQYWCVIDIEPKAIIHALKKGRIGMREAAEKGIRQRIGKATNYREGYQTAWFDEDTSVSYGQHATATCCRRCVEYWHGIPFGRDLTEAEVKYLSELVFHYLDTKIDLTEAGEKVADLKVKRPELF